MIMITSLLKSHSSLGLLALVQIAVEGLSPSGNTRCTEPADQIFAAFLTTKPQGTDIGLTNSRSRIAWRSLVGYLQLRAGNMLSVRSAGHARW
jgi:hypothetical protein